MAILKQFGCWTALTAALAAASGTETWVPYPVPVETSILTKTQYSTCPPPVTVNNTQYLTATTTIYETMFFTDILTTTQPTTETEITTDVQLFTETETTPTTEISIQPTTATEVQLLTATVTTPTTVTETTPVTELVTLTATQELELYTTTTRLTSLRICPTRVSNPTFTVDVPMPTQWTWGCPPGWICKPQQENCDFEAGLPDRNFYCSPNECVPASVLPEPLPNWGSDIYSNSTPLTDPSLGVVALADTFNMNPTDFGLTYDIFVVDKEVVITSTFIVPPAATQAALPASNNTYTRFKGRQAQTTIPAPCYTWCNNGLLEVQSSGKTPRICQPNSAFLISLNSCRACVDAHWVDAPTPDTLLRVAPQFQQFLDYCEGFVTTTTTGTMTATEVSGSETLTSVVETSSVTAIPTSVVTSEPSSSVITSAVVTEVTSTSVSGIAPTPASTYTGSEVTDLTVVVPTNGSFATLSGSDLIGATLIVPAKGASQTEVITSGSSTYTTEITVAPSASQTLGDQTSALEPPESGSATSSGPAVETGDSMAVAIEVPVGLLLGVAVIAGVLL
ncbi:uncharacterized protein HMPREF1541_06385 [Cyphellophora europaea CBS 101466]|uniref:Uncharacterized protein n=1 Tax=Cyphellophora europaea (strain CBS 101466) TaxID=1220924 RepID=W2RPW8_CYPE1|nr:uncharacterized protein HMPREF1541_06385 [Cyphellophora europaea CBS 101466]ETN38350.1 hypothetical protein HMPREF1541_06385 [Cyphellophora europaea CBS 101466]